jgi:hypothetical protein
MPQPPSPRTPGPGAVGGPALPLMRVKPPWALPQAPITPTDYLKLPLRQQAYAAGGAVRPPRIRPRAGVRDYAKNR